jgi:hypothetical protein
MDNASASAINTLINYFRYIRREGSDTQRNPDLAPIRERLIAIQKTEAWGEKKAMLYDLLEDLGLKAGLLNTGYFPYEPVYYFLQYADPDKNMNRESLQSIQYREGGVMPVILMLDEILLSV